jgi:hypothetical protein
MILQLCDTYILNLDHFREAIFEPANGCTEARTEIYTADSEDPTTLYDDEAITAWHRLRDLCNPLLFARGAAGD